MSSPNYTDAKKHYTNYAEAVQSPVFDDTPLAEHRSQASPSFIKTYVFSRYSSPQRLINHTTICAFLGGLYGITQAIEKKTNKIVPCLRYAGIYGSTALAFFGTREQLKKMKGHIHPQDSMRF
eukprot:TRINITY_DN11486_c0_g1_i4.p1 TRINITY_DN11486_c0_g1~~TRINITY_DN11486_c0_g1_i4.p1  ORF type:complete len:123 (-),score=9.57 TRINITY_DN11486_c0_g1_i4:211-579(-)